MSEGFLGTLRDAAILSRHWLIRHGGVARAADVYSQTSTRKGAFTFLVCGAGRSGTSLLACLLDEHDQLEVGFEHAAIASLMGQEVRCKASQIFDRRAQSFLSACAAEAARHPNKYYGNKITTEQLFGLYDHNSANSGQPIDVLDCFFNRALAGIKVVYILRDGRACVRSKLRHTGQSLDLACQRWKYSVEVYRFLQKRHADRLCIRYEDLVACPEAVLTRVCDFLNLPFQSAMLAGTTNPKMPKAYSREGIDTSTTSLHGIPPECVELIRDDLIECGYLSVDQPDLSVR